MYASNNQRVMDESAKIDLTPMLDVVFIMLIFFIVTASFIREASITLDRPVKSLSIPESTNENLIVTLLADNQIFLEDRRIDHRSLRAYFERHHATHPDGSLIISAHNASKTFALAQIAEAARLAGIYQITLANSKESQD